MCMERVMLKMNTRLCKLNSQKGDCCRIRGIKTGLYNKLEEWMGKEMGERFGRRGETAGTA